MEPETQRSSTFTFHCLSMEGRWLALRGPVRLDREAILQSAVELIAVVPDGWQVSVWEADKRVLTVCRKDPASACIADGWST